MALVKLSTTLFIQWKFWENVKDLVLSPFSSAAVDLTLFMLVIPFFVNLLIFWVTDNFLMRHEHNHHKRSFLVNYVGKFNKGMANGCATPQTTIIPTGNGSANGKFSKSHNIIQRAKLYCSNPFSNSNNFNSSYKYVDNESLCKSHNDSVDSFSHFSIDDYDSETGALISGDERFVIDDVEFNDDDCVALEPRVGSKK